MTQTLQMVKLTFVIKKKSVLVAQGYKHMSDAWLIGDRSMFMSFSHKNYFLILLKLILKMLSLSLFFKEKIDNKTLK